MNSQHNGVPADRLKELAEYFDPGVLECRVGKVFKSGKAGLAFFYVTNRAIMDRLDDVCGPENWQNVFKPSPHDPESQSLMCGISILCARPDGTADWVTKWDGAPNTKTEGIKGGYSDSMKRAAYQWGIGRYLYQLPTMKVQLDEYKQIVNVPRVPKHFCPAGTENSKAQAGGSPESADDRPRPMTEDQRLEIIDLLDHPALPDERREAWADWLKKNISVDGAEKGTAKIREEILAAGGLLDDAVIGGDGADHQLAA